MAKKKTAKKKVQRTDWKKEFVLVQEDRNQFIDKWHGLQRKLEEAEEEIAGHSRIIARFENEARKISNRIDEVSGLLHALIVAPEHSSTDGETTNYGREVILGRLVEAVKRIPRAMPF